MEMLDHIIEGQQEGKTAKEIFGDDPLSFTDQHRSLQAQSFG